MPEDEARQADAIVCSREYPTGEMDRDFGRNALFGPVLGTPRVTSREAFGRSLVTREADTTPFLFPKNHPRNPEQRHDWFVSAGEPGFSPLRPATHADFSADLVLLGYLKSEE